MKRLVILGASGHGRVAADIAGKRPEPYLALVRIHLQRNEKESAEKAYRKALQYGAERDASLEEQFK